MPFLTQNNNPSLSTNPFQFHEMMEEFHSPQIKRNTTGKITLRQTNGESETKSFAAV
jgi:hypothetical protein